MSKIVTSALRKNRMVILSYDVTFHESCWPIQFRAFEYNLVTGFVLVTDHASQSLEQLLRVKVVDHVFHDHCNRYRSAFARIIYSEECRFNIS